MSRDYLNESNQLLEEISTTLSNVNEISPTLGTRLLNKLSQSLELVTQAWGLDSLRSPRRTPRSPRRTPRSSRRTPRSSRSGSDLELATPPSGTTCLICLEDVNESNRTWLRHMPHPPHCGQYFHASCLAKMVYSEASSGRTISNRCPVCRTSGRILPEIISDGRNLRDFLEGETSGEPTPPRATRRLAQLFSENPDITGRQGGRVSHRRTHRVGRAVQRGRTAGRSGLR